MQLLVKAPRAAGNATLSLGADKTPYSAQPLFESIGRGEALGAAGAPVWQLLVSAEDEMNAWDRCHELRAMGFGAAGDAVEFAEPDLVQRWPFGTEREIAFSAASGCTAARPQNSRFPTDPDPLWSLERSQLRNAAAQVGAPNGRRVRVAHLDTGYDPQHLAAPEFLLTAEQKNYVEADRPNDARDITGSFGNPGHGPATMAILAGRAMPNRFAFGGAPQAEIIPIRVADSVVLFQNSSIARAFDYVHLLCQTGRQVDVLSLSMGGIASQAWAEALNALYVAGVLVVAAAGNNQGNLPTRNIVFPARFDRVLAACGVMADGSPYADLPLQLMAGNYGPPSKMATAMAAPTPNIPWPQRGCPSIVNLDGAGTSSATPQLAAAAALLMQRHAAALQNYSEPWMRIEAIREALFSSADNADPVHFGRGAMRALDALAVPLPAEGNLHPSPEATARFPWLDVLLGTELGLDDEGSRQMLELEALQLSQSAEVEAVLPDPGVDPSNLSNRNKQQIVDALLGQPGISSRLKTVLSASAPTAVPVSERLAISPTAGRNYVAAALSPQPPAPQRRRLRVFAFDPSIATDPETAAINQAVIDVPWEEGLEPGPIGEYVEVIDVDPASRAAYAPVDLNHHHLLPQDGLAPAEGNPQFHQQMVYAVAMRTIEFFERALGRRALWAPHYATKNGKAKEVFVQRLRIYPHALRKANAYYSPDRKALLLGYFSAPNDTAGLGLPGGLVFTALSHDIIAHETTHALLDGLHRRFREPTNPDVLAFHEAFADIVALFQHFTLPEALRHQIGRTKGNLGEENLMAKLAVEFGQARSGTYRALRDAIGEVKDGKWVEAPADRKAYDPTLESHALGAVLVSAVFAAFLTIYNQRSREVIKLATAGSGVLPSGDLAPALADRLAQEASKVAAQVLRMCIRALDYCPPVDITFGEYLRALITADADLVPDDPRNYRVAFAAAFRDRGIYPRGVRHLSPQNLPWDRAPVQLKNLDKGLKRLTLTWGMGSDRRAAFKANHDNGGAFQLFLTDPKFVSDEELAAFGLVRQAKSMTLDGIAGRLGGIEVHSIRPARRVGPDGQSRTDLVVEITQTFRPSGRPGVSYRGGCTLIVDLEVGAIRYIVRKRITSPGRVGDQARFQSAAEPSHRGTYFGGDGLGAEPFAVLHGVK